MNLMNIKLYKGESLVLEKPNIKYKLDDTELSFHIDDMEHFLNFETQEFTRENDEYRFYLNIAKEICEITLKNEGYHLQLLVEYANLLKNKNYCELTYRIETDDEPIKLAIS